MENNKEYCKDCHFNAGIHCDVKNCVYHNGESHCTAEVISVTMTAERACRVQVAPDQLSLAIGKEGQNARLAARLTGCKIDIKAD